MIDPADPAVGEDRGQVADVALDDVEVGAGREPLAEQAAKSGSRSRTTTRQSGGALLGEDPRDRPGAGTQLDDDAGRCPVDVPDRRPRQPAAARGEAGDGRSVPEELAEEEREIAHRRFLRGRCRRGIGIAVLIGESAATVRRESRLRLGRLALARNRSGSSAGGSP